MSEQTPNIPETNLSELLLLAKQINDAFARRHGNVESSKERALVLLTKIIEETGEISSATRALLGVERQSRTKKEQQKLKKNVSDEAADVIITVLGLLAHLGISDIDAALKEKLQIVIERLQSTGDF